MGSTTRSRWVSRLPVVVSQLRVRRGRHTATTSSPATTNGLRRSRTPVPTRVLPLHQHEAEPLGEVPKGAETLERRPLIRAVHVSSFSNLPEDWHLACRTPACSAVHANRWAHMSAGLTASGMPMHPRRTRGAPPGGIGRAALTPTCTPARGSQAPRWGPRRETATRCAPRRLHDVTLYVGSSRQV